MHKFLGALGGVILVGCSQISGDEMADCVSETLDVQIVRMDENNQRLFVVPNGSVQIKVSAADDVNHCFESSRWNDNWSVSVFSASKYAGYKDEENIIQYHKDGAWSKGYLAEIDGVNKTVTYSPAI
ncbi:hypothetical protein L4C36_21900 [Photobacterium japonica]|uniref:hypothetical protein n=1 Tax=Photobacterium japonica TaxID=2910235 RepID=UPI003D1500BB